MTQATFENADIGPFARALGVRIVAWSLNEARLEMTARAEHLNRSGVLHGGIVSALIDTACGYAGTWCARPGHVRRAVTLSLTTQFIGKAGEGLLIASARVRGGGRKIVFASAEVIDASGRLIGFGDTTLRYLAGSEELDGVPLEAG